jgi:hypothetical protein
MRLGKHVFTKLFVSYEWGKTIIFIPQTPTFVPLFLHMLSKAFEHPPHMGNDELTPTLIPSPSYGRLLITTKGIVGFL